MAHEQLYWFEQPSVWSHIVFKNGVIICFVRINWKIIRICVAVVIVSWSLSSKRLEWNCAIGMVDDFLQDKRYYVGTIFLYA